MRSLLCAAGIVAAAFAGATPALAQNYPWCANFHDGAGVNCGFTSEAQCLATTRGAGGFCTLNNQYTAPGGAAPSHHAARRHRPR